MKKFILLLSTIVLLIFIFVQYRHFYQVGDMTFTVWKRLGGKCYIMPYRYWGLTLPKENYMIVPNITIISIYIDTDSTLIVAHERHHKQNKNEFFLEKYKYLNYPKDLDSIERFRIQLRELRETLPFITLSTREPCVEMSSNQSESHSK